MSRTIPDLHLLKMRDFYHPLREANELTKERKFCSSEFQDISSDEDHYQTSTIWRSGEVYVRKGENDGLIFKRATSDGSEDSCGLRRLKDGTRVHLHLCWNFWNSDLGSKETKELLGALEKVVRVLKELDCEYVHQPSEGNGDSRRNGRVPEADFQDREDCDPTLRFQRMYFTPESSRKKHAPFDSKFESNRLQDELFENGGLHTGEKTHDVKCEQVRSPSVVPGKRKILFEDVDDNNFPHVFGREKIPGCEENSGHNHCPTTCERKKKKCGCESDTAHDSRDLENGNKVRETVSEQHKVRNFLRDRELKKKDRESVPASARKTASDYAMRYGEGHMHDCPQRDAPTPDQLKKQGCDSGFDMDREKIGISAFELEKEREKIRSSHNLHQRRTFVNLVDDLDEAKMYESDTGLPPEDLIGRSCGRLEETRESSKGHQSRHGRESIPLYASDANRVRSNGFTQHTRGFTTSPHSNGFERGGTSNQGVTVHPKERNGFSSTPADELLNKGQQMGVAGKGKRKVTFRADKYPKRFHKKVENFSVPKVDEKFNSPNWKSLDDHAKVMTILNQFYYLEQYYKSAKEENDRRLRSDLKAGHYLLTRGFCLNHGFSVVGPIPGVSIGQCFRYREELVLLAIHRAQQAGIDYISASKSSYRDAKGNSVAVAVSIVASGGYKDNIDDGTTLIYSGQGGYSNKTYSAHKSTKKIQDQNQELVRGNLAMVNSYKLRVPVRVTRGILAEDRAKRLYVYDGMYDVKKCYEETGASGFKVWKFKLVKQAGQTDAPSCFPKDEGRNGHMRGDQDEAVDC